MRMSAKFDANGDMFDFTPYEGAENGFAGTFSDVWLAIMAGEP